MTIDQKLTGAPEASATQPPEPGASSYPSVFADAADAARFFDALTDCCAEGECPEHRRERAGSETEWRRKANQPAAWKLNGA
ncbi:hypothetical protein GCM10010172_04470 [Paractinoplanes ferrugineus]|uniref:Uncharacterized protein n=1 Tax=Paractinoplanes ferrugineus TaxID=113564 RepID=A0A919MQY9_9ACTN|nr:hypothetical protein [Actinoplanes ferrugineus]GIE16832.1 hypothetical protein Afe05nite_86720 [Actinoplanes ferrugineus]